jgi:superfamily I DNA and/or RNA helicase
VRYVTKGIGKIKKYEFHHFMAVKQWVEKEIVREVPVVVSTCKAAKGKLLRRQLFPRVIIDEATQAHEIETLETIINAKKVVLVGDQQ